MNFIEKMLCVLKHKVCSIRLILNQNSPLLNVVMIGKYSLLKGLTENYIRWKQTGFHIFNTFCKRNKFFLNLAKFFEVRLEIICWNLVGNLFTKLIYLSVFMLLFRIAQGKFRPKCKWTNNTYEGIQWKLESGSLSSYWKMCKKYLLQHVYMRPKVNSNWFEISLRDKILLRCQVTLLSTFTWLRAEWNLLWSNWLT